MEFFTDLFAAVRDHPTEVLICIALPVALGFILRGDGHDGGGTWGDGDGGGGD